jgi:hypothetical protein
MLSRMASEASADTAIPAPSATSGKRLLPGAMRFGVSGVDMVDHLPVLAACRGSAFSMRHASA